jgi:hypothetical protein
VSKDSDQTETAPNGEQTPMVYPGKEERGRFKASDCVEAAARMRVTARYSGAAEAGTAGSCDRGDKFQLDSERRPPGAFNSNAKLYPCARARDRRRREEHPGV